MTTPEQYARPSRHRQRHGNAFRAGGREAMRELLADLLAASPPEWHADLRRIVEARVVLPKWRIGRLIGRGGE